MRTSSGRVTIPATVRTMRATRLVDQYLKYLQQTSQEHLKKSRSTLIKLLKVCTARQSKALAGIDYYTTNAGEGFDNLIEVVSKIAERNDDVPRVCERDMKTSVQESRQYYKMNFKLHLHRNSKVSDHCFAHALSDPNDAAFQEVCTDDHVHDDTSLLCSSCERLKDALAEIQKIQHETTYSIEAEKNYDAWRVQKAIDDIEKYKAHILRGVWSDMAKQKVLKNLAANEVFIRIDWAMKFLPRRAREGQTGWFGKRGISWHIAVAVIKDRNGNFLKRTYVHVFQQANQVSSEVTAILDHILRQISDEQNHITTAIIRSDNAMHYKASSTIASIPELSNGPIVIERWMFSEPQTGKGPADRAAARIKRHVYMYVDEKKDAVTAQEFIEAASSYNGLKDVSLFMGNIGIPQDTAASATAGPSKKKKPPTIPKISKLYDFQYRQTVSSPYSFGLLRGWRMSGFGRGFLIERKYWKDHGNEEKFTVTLERHENEHFKRPGGGYWKPVGATYYPVQEAREAMEETDAGVVDESDEFEEPERAVPNDDNDDDDDDSSVLIESGFLTRNSTRKCLC